MLSPMLVITIVGLTRCEYDTYREWVEQSPESPLVTFVFEIETFSNSSKFLDIFPQSFASVLIANRPSIQSLVGRIVRGRWKASSNPTGSSMILTDLNRCEKIWTQSAWLLSTVLGASFESLAPEQKSFSWITPMDVSESVRVGANPNEPVCTDNIQRLVQLLPCRDRRGIGKTLMDLALPLASSEYISISVNASNLGGNRTVLRGEVEVVLPVGDYAIKDACPAGISMKTESVSIKKETVKVLRSMIGSELGPERRYGKLVLVVENQDSLNSHSIEIHEQLPFFLVPLMRTSQNLSGARIRWSKEQSDSPTYFVWSLMLSPGESKLITIDVYKKFIPMSEFSFSFEKGFDIGSAAYRVDASEWQLTRGLVVVIPLPDQTSTFNAMAVAVTPIALFFGIVFRGFIEKRSELADQRKSAERDPPLFRLIRFIWQRIRSLLGKNK